MCYYCFFFFFFNDTATTEIYTLSLHDALPISTSPASAVGVRGACGPSAALAPGKAGCAALKPWRCEFPPACKPVRGFVCRAEAIPDHWAARRATSTLSPRCCRTPFSSAGETTVTPGCPYPPRKPPL